MLVDVSKRDLSVTLLGSQKVSVPVGIAPTAMQKMAHPDGECASARAAAAKNTVFVLSTISTTSIEDVAQAAPNAIKWFQLYIYKDREVGIEFIGRAK
jgi:(S)-2-hydroxy-acid oxidase